MNANLRQISLLSLLWLIAASAVGFALVKYFPPQWWTGVQALVLIPLVMFYAFSWTILLLIAPALLAIFPGMAPAAPVLRWCLGVGLAIAEGLFFTVWLGRESLGLLLTTAVSAIVIWLIASIAIREYLEPA